MHDEMSTRWNELFTTFQDGPMCSGYPACLEGRCCQEPGAALTGDLSTPGGHALAQPSKRQTGLFVSFALCHSAHSILP